MSRLIKTAPFVAAAALAAAVPAFAQTAAPAPAAPAAAPAAPATPPPNYNTQYTAFFDGYYAYQFENPKKAAILGNFPVRAYDDRHNTPTLALGEVNIFQTPKPGGFGYKTTLGAGDIADTNAGGLPGVSAPDDREGRFKNILQAYGTVLFGASGAGLDFGKFYTPIGYEVTESNGNFNETHSIPYEMVPFYHFGVRAYTPSYSGLVLTGYVVNAVYNTENAGVQNDNGSASFVGSGAWTDPKGKWVVVESVAFGKNKFNLHYTGPADPADLTGLLTLPDTTKNSVTVSDTDLTYNLDANHTLGFDYTYANTKPDSVSNPDSAKATDSGLAVYYKQILTPKTDFALRYSDGQFKADPLAGVSVQTIKPWEATATYEYHETSNVTTRLEFQYADANTSNYTPFLDSNSNSTKKTQDVVEVAELVSF